MRAGMALTNDALSAGSKVTAAPARTGSDCQQLD